MTRRRGRPARLYEFRGEMLDAHSIAAIMERHPCTVYRRLVGNRVLDLGENPDPYADWNDLPATREDKP